MTHKKSIILAFFAATLAAATTYTFSACDDDNETTGQLKFAQQRLDMTVGEAKENIVYEGVPPYAAWSSDRRGKPSGQRCDSRHSVSWPPCLSFCDSLRLSEGGRGPGVRESTTLRGCRR